MNDWSNFPWELVFLSDAFVNDARHLAAIPEPQFKTALSDIRKETGFMEPPRLREVLAKAIGIEEQSDAVVNVITNFRRPELKQRLPALLEILDRTLQRQQQIGEPEKSIVKSRVRALLEPLPAVELHIKAEGLSRATGQRYVSHRFVTDLRPVFDDGRARIEGLFPITTLSITTEDVDEERTIEIVLSESQIEHLSGSADEARRKVQSIKGLLSRLGLPVPNVGMVGHGDTDDSES